jgi:hypothetical protein
MVEEAAAGPAGYGKSFDEQVVERRALGRFFLELGDPLIQTMCVPVYLEPEVQPFPIERAASKGVPLDRLVNDLLKGDEAFRALG